jgi:hypothetical protein
MRQRASWIVRRGLFARSRDAQGTLGPDTDLTDGVWGAASLISPKDVAEIAATQATSIRGFNKLLW